MTSESFTARASSRGVGILLSCLQPGFFVHEGEKDGSQDEEDENRRDPRPLIAELDRGPAQEKGSREGGELAREGEEAEELGFSTPGHEASHERSRRRLIGSREHSDQHARDPEPGEVWRPDREQAGRGQSEEADHDRLLDTPAVVHENVQECSQALDDIKLYPEDDLL